MLLFHCILKLMYDLFKRENLVFKQQVYWYFCIVQWGKTGPAQSFPPSKLLGSFYLSSRLLDYVNLLLYCNSLDLYQAENQDFKPTSLFIIVGWGKTGPAHSFLKIPFSLIFRSSIDRFVFWLILLFHSILKSMKDLYQSENQVFNPTRLLVLLHCGVGIDWAGPFFPPSKMFGSFYLSSRLLDYVILLLYCNSLDLYQAENQDFKPTSLFIIVGWGKTGPAHSFLKIPFSLIFRSSIDRFVFWLILLFHSILKSMKDLYQSENQVFNPTRLLVLLHCGVGIDWAGPFFPPSKMFGSFYLSSRLLDYVILLLYLNSLNLYQAENQVFKPTSLFVIVGWGKTGPAHSSPPP